MRRALAALIFLVGLASAALAQGTIVGPGQQVLCPQIAILAPGPTALTQIIAAVPNKSIYICGWHITNTGATGTFGISIGTGSNCGTGTVTVFPPTNVTSTAPSADHIDYASISVPQNTAVCVSPSVATISFLIYYNQF